MKFRSPKTVLVALAALALISGSAFGQATVFKIEGGDGCFGAACGTGPWGSLVKLKEDGAQINIEATNAAAAARTLVQLRNAGTTILRVINSDASQTFDFKVSGSGFLVNKPGAPAASQQLTSSGRWLLGSGGSTARIEANGNMTIAGSLTQGSDANSKENFRPVVPEDVLKLVVDLPISTWNYIDTPDRVRHLGPTAQDFHAAFGLGDTDTGISTIDTAGVALAAIQGLHKEVENRDARIAELEESNRELWALMGEMKAELASLRHEVTGDAQALAKADR